MSRAAVVNWLIVLAVVVLVAVPLVLGSSTEFAGADGRAAALIEEEPGFEPWATPLWEPASETASGLFAVQAAIGAGFLGYFFGVARTRRRLTAVPAVPAGPGGSAPGATDGAGGPAGPGAADGPPES